MALYTYILLFKWSYYKWLVRDIMDNCTSTIKYMVLTFLIITISYFPYTATGNNNVEDYHNRFLHSHSDTQVVQSQVSPFYPHTTEDQLVEYNSHDSFEVGYNTSLLTKDNVVSESLRSKFETIPKRYWSSTSVSVIVSFNSSYYSTQQKLRDYYQAHILNVLPMAFVTTTLSQAAELFNLDGIKNIYLDTYQQFVNPKWNTTESKLMVYPSETYIGARTLLELGIDGTGVKIAIIDTGIDKTHPDLDDIDNNPETDDPKVIAEQSFVDYNHDGVNDTDANDNNGHGTHCAGIAAANGTIVGIAPGAYLLNAKALDAHGMSYVSWVLNAINWALINGADVISMSIGWGSGDVIRLLNEAVDAAWEAGAIVVVAAGNSGPLPSSITSPGMSSRALTVGATDMFNGTTFWSSRGPSINGMIDPDVVAPGSNILSTIPGNSYAIYSGTSMSTPAVAGVVALLRSVYPSVNISLIRSSILCTATNIDRSVFEQGSGLVNATKAFEYLQSPSNFMWPSFSATPLKLSPYERFNYQCDIYVKQSYTALSIEVSTNLAPYVSISFIDSPLQSGWIRTNVTLTMPSSSIVGSLFLKNGTTVLCSAVLALEMDIMANDANSNTDAGETLGGAIPLFLNSSYDGSLFPSDMKDIYTFSVVEGNAYKVILNNLLNDADLFIADESGEIIAYSLNYDTVNEIIEFTAQSSGNYFIIVESYYDTAYTLLLKETMGFNQLVLLTLTDRYDSYAIDSDADGLFDYLNITVELNVSIAGLFNIFCSISQFRADYEYKKYEITGNMTTVSLPKGLCNFTISIDSNVISESHYDGSYIISEFTVYDPITEEISVHRKDVYHTVPYYHEQFKSSSNQLTNISYIHKNLDGIGGPELFSVVCTLNVHASYGAFQLVIVDDTHRNRIVWKPPQEFSGPDTNVSVSFTFSGYELRKLKRDIVIAGYYIFAETEGYFVPIYDVLPAAEFAAYEPLLTYHITDTIIDTNSNGKPDTLSVDVSIDSKIETGVSISYCDVLISLVQEIAVGTGNYLNVQQYITLGENHVTFEFDLKPVGARKLMGPYLIPSFIIQTSDGLVQYFTSHVTDEYDYYTFDTPQVYVSQYLGAEAIYSSSAGIQVTFEIISAIEGDASVYLTVEEYYSETFNTFDFTTTIDLTFLHEGSNIVSVRIPCEHLFDAKFTGELLISHLYVELDYEIVHSLTHIDVIRNVDYRTFKNYYDICIIDYTALSFSNDSDPLYEGINLTIHVYVNTPGRYIKKLEILMDRDEYVSFTEELVFGSTGFYNIPISIPSSQIVRGVQSSRKLITRISLQNVDTFWSDTILIVLYPSLRDFDYTLPVVFNNIVDFNLVDENNDSLYELISLTVELNVTVAKKYSFEFTFSTMRSTSSQHLIDSFTIYTNPSNYSYGIQQVHIHLSTAYLTKTLHTLENYEEEEFVLLITKLKVLDSVGFYSTYFAYEIIDTFNISIFEVQAPLSVFNIEVFLEDTNGDFIAEYINVQIDYCTLIELDNLRFIFSGWFSYKVANQDRSTWFQRYITTNSSLGNNSLVMHIRLTDIFADAVPKQFELAGAFVKVEGNLITTITISIPYHTFSIYLPGYVPPTQTTPIPTKKNGFPVGIMLVIFVFVGIGFIVPTKRQIIH